MAKYKSKIDISNKENSHTAIIEMVCGFAGSSCLKILDVGCSTGYVGSFLKEIGHVVYGVEPEIKSATIAKENLDSIYNTDIFSFIEKYPEEKFDIIIFGDIIEHLAEPSILLEKIKKCLAPNGQILISTPNICHKLIRGMLLEGRWEYGKLGILDETHLRFFDQKSLEKLIVNSGFNIIELSKVKINLENASRICNIHISQKTSKIISETSSQDININTFQFIVRATLKNKNIETSKNPEHTGLHVIAIIRGRPTALEEIRIINPLRAWAAYNKCDVTFLDLYNLNPKDLNTANVVIFHRVVGEYEVAIAKNLKKSGVRIIYEIDDNLLCLPDFLGHHKPGLSLNIKNIRAIINIADQISVSTARLASHIKKINPHIEITPSHSITTYRRSKHFQTRTNEISIVFAASDKVLIDFITEPLLFIQKKFNVKILVIGPLCDAMKDSGLSIEPYEILSYENFKHLIGSIDNLIGVIPLDKSEFSKCKSAIKFMDYSMAGIPSICSNTPPYSDIIENNKHAILTENTYESWVDAIETLILSPTKRAGLASSGADLVGEQFNRKASAEAWKRIIEKTEPNHNLKIKIYSLGKLYAIHKLKKIIYALLKPELHLKALNIIKKEGVRGIAARIKRY